MPSAEFILANLHASANQWWPVAALWHGYVVAVAVYLYFRRPVELRTVRTLFAVPLVSVSVVAWMTGDFFNAVSVALVFALLVAIGLADFAGRARRGPLVIWGIGLSLIALGWVYPHFLEAGPGTYLYAAPLGVLPCPTLAMLVGVSLVLSGSSTSVYPRVLAAIAAIYGLFGALYLGVIIDAWLVVGALCLVLASFFGRGESEGEQRAAT
jgi:hypothetical protein